ncbi:hypothetical protein [Pedobacter sp. UYP1]|uniref:hypothetical protein n=1 Tax=Pedobacter sp. UYP1 TaxID=1756396 RepID=UPI003392BF86
MEHVKIDRQFTLVYDNIFDVEIDIPTTLKDLPQLSSVEFISMLLHLFNIRKKSDTEFQNIHLYRWMMRMEGHEKSLVLAFVMQHAELINSPSFILLSRRPCLDLIQHLLVYAKPKSDQELSKKDYADLFKVLLLFNKKEANLQKDVFHWNGDGDFEEFADRVLSVQIRNIENERPKNYALQFLKAYYFFGFCETDAQYSTYLQTFLVTLELTSYKSYLWHILSPYLDLITSEVSIPKMYVAPSIALNFFMRLTINERAGLDDDYKQIRSYPLLELVDNTFLFLDFRFFVDKFYHGFLFDFAATTGLNFPKLKQELGEGFSEQVLFYTIMKSCFCEYGDINLNGQILKAKLGSAEPDYYIRQGNAVFIFEFKDIVIPAQIKYAENIEKIKGGIFEKLERDAKGYRKGITQLLNSIKSLCNGDYKRAEIDILPDRMIVYPIIVHTDISLESQGINYFLNKRIHQLADEMDLSRSLIGNLILINIETLMQLQDYFCDGTLDLVKCVELYTQFITSGNPVNDTFAFDEFIKRHCVKTIGKRIRPPKIFFNIIRDYERNA